MQHVTGIQLCLGLRVLQLGLHEVTGGEKLGNIKALCK